MLNLQTFMFHVFCKMWYLIVKKNKSHKIRILFLIDCLGSCWTLETNKTIVRDCKYASVN